jgi:hypothetical protein
MMFAKVIIMKNIINLLITILVVAGNADLLIKCDTGAFRMRDRCVERCYSRGLRNNFLENCLNRCSYQLERHRKNCVKKYN